MRTTVFFPYNDTRRAAFTEQLVDRTAPHIIGYEIQWEEILAN